MDKEKFERDLSNLTGGNSSEGLSLVDALVVETLFRNMLTEITKLQARVENLEAVVGAGARAFNQHHHYTNTNYEGQVHDVCGPDEEFPEIVVSPDNL